MVLEYIYTFSKENSVNTNGLLFIWVIIVNILFYNLNNKYLKYPVMLIMMIAPIFIVKPLTGSITLFVISISSLIYYFGGFYKVDYDAFIDIFKKGFIIIIAISVLSIPRTNFIYNMNQITPYMIIYLVSGISILRIIRFEDSEQDIRILGRMNLRYNYVTLGMAFFLCIQAIRTMIYDSMLAIWNVIFYAVAFIFTAIFFVFERILYVLVSILSKAIGNTKLTSAIFQTGTNPMEDKKIEKIANLDHFLNGNFLHMIECAIIITLIIFLIMKLYTRASLTNRKQEEYEEEKAFIRKSENGRKTLMKRISEHIKHKNNTEIIRFHYKRFLKQCIQNNIVIKVSDTTSDVNRKVKSKLMADVDGHILTTFREIYIKIRYGGEEANKNDVEQFINAYEEVKKMKE